MKIFHEFPSTVRIFAVTVILYILVFEIFCLCLIQKRMRNAIFPFVFLLYILRLKSLLSSTLDPLSAAKN
jgi:hypothetical protein